MLDNLKGEDIKVYSVWVPILPSDLPFTVGRATKYLDDDRVVHYWDGDGVLVQGFVPVLELEKFNKHTAWDIYLLYGDDAEWTNTPPKPIYWQEQLGISDETQLDTDKLTAEIRKLMDQGAK